MQLTIVVAASENNVIGKENQLPWHLPDDLRFFKKTTLGKPVLMGRKTFESLGKPLVNRLNIVLSTGTPALPEGVMLFHDADEALKYLSEQGHEEICIIGGGAVFAALLPKTDVLYMTRVHTDMKDGETFFPPINRVEWQLAWEEFHPADEKHAYSFTFQRFERIT